MTLPDCKTLLLELNKQVLSITLNRPKKRNAMNSQMVAELGALFKLLASDLSVRAVVLRGEGGHFCAGGDISGMHQDSKQDEQAAIWQFNRSFGHLISKVNRAPQIVICVLEGSVLGGGFGLACVSDYAIATSTSRFAMPETTLGIIPAQISPFVVMRIGLTQTRRLSLLGESINGEQALNLGLIHELSNDVDKSISEVLEKARRCAPQATATTKNLILDIAEREQLEKLLDRAADDFSSALNSVEGREGTHAFMQKRKPNWAD